MVESLRALPVLVLPVFPAAGGVVIGAVAGAGGWLVNAPGMPEALELEFCDSLLCLLRTAAVSAV